ncbi:hypothetical protein Ahy_A09g043988 [Arachis hypogaea]|uniref:Aminotransferase-like plant mobile domain-containing protein n=1 Tax=Arachis hypogaea TaxID=3818 RepID=A0A445BJF1_ARAHY|nr:hypothetical protein Ahy_A09g043988 [Arachis hypogaea]
MLFVECMIILQDVAYHLGLPIDDQYDSGCLTDFPRYIEGGRPPWVWFEELLGVLSPANCIDKFTVKCTWFEKTFSELPQRADEETVRRYARAYIMMLLSTQLFGKKSSIRLHIQCCRTSRGWRTWVSTVGVLLHCHGYTGACAVWRIEMWSSWLVHCSSSSRGSFGGSLDSDRADLMFFISHWRRGSFNLAMRTIFHFLAVKIIVKMMLWLSDGEVISRA